MISPQEARNLVRSCVEAITGRLTVSEADAPGTLRLQFGERTLFVEGTPSYRDMCERLYQATEALFGLRAQWPQQEQPEPAKVVRLATAQPEPGLVPMLENMLEQARAGHLAGMLALGNMRDGQQGQWSAGDMTPGDVLHAFEMWKADQYGGRE